MVGNFDGEGFGGEGIVGEGLSEGVFLCFFWGDVRLWRELRFVLDGEIGDKPGCTPKYTFERVFDCRI